MAHVRLSAPVEPNLRPAMNITFGASGSLIYAPAALGSMAGLNVLGDPAAGAQAGDRTLAAGSNEVLCFQVSLPTSTNNTFQNVTTTASLLFNSEQTTNNP